MVAASCNLLFGNGKSMGEPALQPDLLTVEEYLAFEAKSEIRHEYWNGYIRAMSGAAPPHVTLASQLSYRLNAALDGSTCQAGNSDMAVRIDAENAFVYPDVVVWCDEAEFDEMTPRILLTPLVVAEVLSPSTSSHDPTAKLQAYLKIPSLMDYLILSPERVSVEHYTRGQDGAWPYRHYVLRSQIIRLDRLGTNCRSTYCTSA